MDVPKRGTADIDADDTLVSLFRRVAKANPDREALADSNGSYTYSELDHESDRVAEALRQLGAGREGQRIGLVAYRSRFSVTGLLGILKAGCAYVPLDPAIPPKRRDHIVRESSLALILDVCQEPDMWWRDQSAEAANAANAADSASAPESDERERSEPSADDSAYVIYTSGSTGVPKGCEVSHRNVVALLRAALPLFSASSVDVWTVVHSLAFDFSVLEVWGAFATSGKAVMVDDATVIDPSALCDLLDKQAVTIVNIVPSAFAAILAAGRRRPATVRLIVFGGEPVPFGVLRRFLEAGDWPSADRPHVANMYGITETTVRQALPRYMIPSHVVAVDALPATASGKRDRARLSAIWNDRQAAV